MSKKPAEFVFPDQWVYLVDTLMRPFDLQTHLNLRGRAGWELVRYEPRLRDAELVFKRKASNEQ